MAELATGTVGASHLAPSYYDHSPRSIAQVLNVTVNKFRWDTLREEPFHIPVGRQHAHVPRLPDSVQEKRGAAHLPQVDKPRGPIAPILDSPPPPRSENSSPSRPPNLEVGCRLSSEGKAPEKAQSQQVDPDQAQVVVEHLRHFRPRLHRLIRIELR